VQFVLNDCGVIQLRDYVDIVSKKSVVFDMLELFLTVIFIVL